MVNTSFFFGNRYVGSEMTSFGTSIASIGLPAVIVPSRATLTVSSFFSKYSLGTNNSKALFFDSFFFLH